ncbi:unnamed protein product (macronuclear) [Paramecium tetraurelia]|uniref:Uncharacterized protein n=1 Tax=Paramecium tetraurelia TaxID=5888 RepID=A0C510_PARTE|nr:uncharacterized protein GSPATT00006376001 [Paramecium tetraurelia]CAK65877.1 unnamed protein product [Paramecium tetraurelia]|eukprot:XP_001433274.1 hypothetical protein (macronuclear) [Paramecium tetraurelia strain d4-2]
MLSSNRRNGIQIALSFDDVLLVSQNSILKAEIISFMKLTVVKISSSKPNLYVVLWIQLQKLKWQFVWQQMVGQVQSIDLQQKTKKVKDQKLILKQTICCWSKLHPQESLYHSRRMEKYDIFNIEESDENGSPRYKSISLLRIITNRDFYEQPLTQLKKELMTPKQRLVTPHYLDDISQIRQTTMEDNKNNISLKDLIMDSILKVLDQIGRLIIEGAFVSNDDEITKAKKLINFGCDVIVWILIMDIPDWQHLPIINIESSNSVIIIQKWNLLFYELLWASNIAGLQKNIQFIQMTNEGFVEAVVYMELQKYDLEMCIIYNNIGQFQNFNNLI